MVALEDRFRVPPDRVSRIAVGSTGTGVAATSVGRGWAVGVDVGWTTTVGVGVGNGTADGEGVAVTFGVAVAVEGMTDVGVGLTDLEHPADITAAALNVRTRACRMEGRGRFIPSRALRSPGLSGTDSAGEAEHGADTLMGQEQHCNERRRQEQHCVDDDRESKRRLSLHSEEV